MNEKLKEFFQTKKELFVFLGLLIVTFVSVITIAEVTIFNKEETPQLPDDSDDTTNDDLDDDDDDTTVQPDVSYKFELPVLGNQIVIREFYDYSTPGLNQNAIIETSSGYIQSKGISYANEDDSSFDVVSIYPGKVVSVEEDEVLGTSIKIDHGNDLISVYSSLSKTTVKVGDVVASKAVIGTSGESAFDLNASNHVHVEVISDGKYVSLKTIIGKTMDDVVSSIK